MRALIAVAIIAVGCFAAAPPAKPQAAKPATASKPQVTRTPYKTWAANRYSRYRAPVLRWTPVRRPAYAYQMQPSVDRYKEIQQALTDKGYFSGEVNGTWDALSIDAMKRFQVDQSIPPGDGRMNSLSLIALGLGPKRDNSGAVPNPTKDAVSAPTADSKPAIAEN